MQSRMMKYLRHPFYDYSDALEWIELKIDYETERPVGGDTHPLAKIILRDFDYITSEALVRIKQHETSDCLKERPYPLLGLVCYCPTSDAGIRVFVQYHFMEKPNENSPHTDSWWVILQGPYTDNPPHGLPATYSIIDLGWRL